MIGRSISGVCVVETFEAPKVENERADADNEEVNAELLEEDEDEEIKEPASPEAKEDVVTGIVVDVVVKDVGAAVFETLAVRGVWFCLNDTEDEEPFKEFTGSDRPNPDDISSFFPSSSRRTGYKTEKLNRIN